MFDSKKEALRYQELKLLEAGGIIKALALQVDFPIIINDHKICSWKADFVYIEDGKRVVEDTKGFKNRVYKLKKKLVEVVYGIKIKET